MGLQTSEDKKFIRKSEWVDPNARRKDTLDVPEKNTIAPEELSNLTIDEKENGMKVLDPKKDKYYVPFDKGGEQDIEGGEFNNFWKPVDYWIDWSEKSVRTLKERSEWPIKTPKKPRFQNAKHYFKTGIVCTGTGLYAPNYYLSFGGIFGHQVNLLLPFDRRLTKYLLIILSSKLIRYLAKSTILNTVSFVTDCHNYLPIVVPTQKQLNEANDICDEVIKLKKENFGQKGLTSKVDKLVEPFVNDLYGLDKDDILEIQTWFKRRYPHFGRNLD